MSEPTAIRAAADWIRHAEGPHESEDVADWLLGREADWQFRTSETALAEVERRLSAKLVEPGLRKSQFGGLSLAIEIVREMRGGNR